MGKKKVTRTVTSHLIIKQLCKKLHMSEEKLLVHLVVETNQPGIMLLSDVEMKDINATVETYRKNNIYAVEVKSNGNERLLSF